MVGCGIGLRLEILVFPPKRERDNRSVIVEGAVTNISEGNHLDQIFLRLNSTEKVEKNDNDWMRGAFDSYAV